jgi:hypothetical protein
MPTPWQWSDLSFAALPPLRDFRTQSVMGGIPSDKNTSASVAAGSFVRGSLGVTGDKDSFRSTF